MDHRIKLEQLEGERFHIICEIGRFGTKSGYRSHVQTIMLKDVLDFKTGDLLCDHLWMTCGKWSQPLLVGSIVSFAARSGDYIKGYRGRESEGLQRDWKLFRPTKVVIYH